MYLYFFNGMSVHYAESVEKEKPAADPKASAVDRLTAATEARLAKAAAK